jgi:hypothetical protein
MHDMLHTLSGNMFHLPVPIAEKILRPAIVYLFLIVFLRLFGKRELAQLNPFDLVVLLSLSNTVQNAMIGDDNSVTGGVLGAFSLLAINWLLMWLLYRAPKLDAALEGTARGTGSARSGLALPACDPGALGDQPLGWFGQSSVADGCPVAAQVDGVQHGQGAAHAEHKAEEES